MECAQSMLNKSLDWPVEDVIYMLEGEIVRHQADKCDPH
jgi:hypothetical protein